MPAAIESMAYAGDTPWHGLGQRLTEEEGRRWERVHQQAGLDWTVEKVRLMTSDTKELVNHYVTRRTRDGKILGTVGPRYCVLQNDEAFRWFQPFLDAGEAVIHTAGSLRGGARVWVLARLQRDPLVIAPGDVVDKFVLLSHSHDGSLAVRVGFTPVRVVCNNTLAMAHDSQASRLIRVYHTRGLQDHLSNLREAMNLANQEFEASAALYRRLQHRAINQNDLARYVRLVLGTDDDPPSSRLTHLLEEIFRLHEEGRGSNLPGVRGTLWGAYNAFNEWLVYGRGSRQDVRLDSLWYGSGARLNERALDVALDLAG
jgi:phage/plasmid-like protein (TIGR03299 family)